MTQSDPVSIQIIQGKPIQVQGHCLVPVARVFSIRQHQAVIAPSHVRGSGWGVMHAQPVEIIETTDGSEQHILIPDPTAKILLQMLVIAAIATLVSIGLIVANRRAES